jgi:putative tryptophan/tyrosine transport system substrate-binding protein
VRRRAFITLLGGTVASRSFLWPLAARAQQPSHIPRIGILRFGPRAAYVDRVEALRSGLRQLGYVEGNNIVVEFRWAETVDQLREVAAELVHMNVDIIFATSSTEVEAARQATKTIPIVFATHADPVGVGHVTSLARPGGNITGLSMLLTELVAKELEILKEVVSRMTRVGVLFTSTAPSYRPAVQALETAGKALGVQLVMVQSQAVEDFEEAFSTMSREQVGGFLAVATPPTLSHRHRLAELALKYRLPSMFGTKENVEAGGLISYGPDLRDLTRRAATYIDKILKGAKPSELPVEQASKYQLVINLKTAKALGVDVPLHLQQLADEVIE